MRTVKELLDDRSAEFASRPAFSGMDAVTGGRYFVTAPAESHYWKISRKVIQPLVSPQAVQKYHPLADMETTQLLYDILHKPEAFYDHITRSTLSFITSVVFGQRTPKHDSPIALSFREYIEQFSRVFSPESAPVDFIPALMYVPERWAPWKKMWKETQAMQHALYFKLFGEVEKRKRAGMNDECFVANMLERQEELALERDTIAYICGVLLDGGAETTASFLQNLILCLVKSPAVLKKAQMEVDSVVGDRLPDFNDIKSMPYVQAVIKETHRFLPTAPTAIPHASVDDSEYRGYIIPKKTPVLINVYLYERPEDFWPERYLLAPDGTISGLPDGMGYARTTLSFGSGKRLCPGMYLANTNTNLAVMRLLWAFDFASIDFPAPSTPKWDIENEFIDVSILL
uniref:Cytochrome P450 n=1 Tax=Psilocybe cubensis TaxID=181762 RepID=A0A8H8CFE4_PSICU